MNNGKICVSVCAETADEMIANIKRAEQFADVIEVRFDCLPSDQIETLRSQISDCNFEKPLLATFRAHEQGGHREVSRDERRVFWQEPKDSYWAADLEEDAIIDGGNYSEKIVSFHDFDGVPVDLDQIYERLAAMDADIIKLAVNVNDITDAISVWNLLERAKADGKQIIPIAMGEAGKWTRILGLAHGAFLTYASLDAGRETADGQITAKELIDTYRVKELDKNTEVFGVIGDPVSQSLSPYMHNAEFAAASVNAVFMHLLVKNLDAFIRRMVKPETREVELNFGGFSVTMPHKQAIIPHLDAIDPTAAKIGAVNTIRIDDGKLTGYNTDARGFITPLLARFGDVRDARVAIFGAGGASRACVYALMEEGADVTIFARDPEKAKIFAHEFGIKHEQLTTDNRQLKTDIIVDATPLGMKGPLEHESLFSADELSGVKFVYDLVTSVADTPIVRAAKTAGIPAIGGLEMLIAQGVKQFEIWTGKMARPDKMREILLTSMKG
ncbi:MAG: shikimate dehydrogenase [Pyrinomonadaceae bacterium]|nr:shikimate dehydrogenase [Pyrinomonadaceae bacterium]